MKKNNTNIHYKKIQTKQVKKENKEQYEENNNNFNLDDINNQLDEILENIELDGIDEINKKIVLIKIYII